MSERITYSSYLKINNILDQQIPLSKSYHEELFIIVHQISELWFKLIINNIYQIQKYIIKEEIEKSIKLLDRIISIQKQLNSVWDVLSELSPSDYLSFRNHLGNASGFQSFQYRFLEFKLGKKNKSFLDIYEKNSHEYIALSNEFYKDSLYDQVKALVLKKSDYSLFEKKCEEVYKYPENNYILYMLLEKLVAVDCNFKEWRFKHMNTVQKVIGMKKGTGGSKGVSYLKKIVDYEFFPDIWEIRTQL
ncbi:tryptophan 2,3-dioxygenase [Staphylococcus epidermidis]|uniref:tryptophan 2,3-dioxygenase n=1 Tax=Staphylococcus epidermidis TaxID=1282 RepID=UPI0019337E9D|nr:tryptophan 2,3-dioxygenase family protein [Staphylococcus epidermidis]MBM0838687.1 tryptophan 2,3-dioxygenase [Staphylococcus epidermidis]